MNLALWLERAGQNHADRPAVGSGERVAMTDGALAERAARLAGALRERCGLKPGDRVAIAARNAPDYVALMYGIWHAGLAAVPANAKLHGREFGYILEHSGARVCFASDGLDTEIAPHAPASLERLITVGSADYAALFTADPIACVPRAGDDLAWLFYTSGTTGRPKGAMLTHRVLAVASHAYLAEVEAGRPVDPEEWIRRHPAIAGRLRACLRGLHLVEAAAEALERASVPLIYRVHDDPDPQRVNALREFLKTDYRGLEALLRDWSDLRQALGLTKVPDHSTLQKAAVRLLEKKGSPLSSAPRSPVRAKAA